MANQAIALRPHVSHIDQVIREYEQTVAVYRAMNSRFGNRLRQMLPRWGVVGTIERLVVKKAPSKGLLIMIAAGRADETFEAIVLRHPTYFSAKAVKRATMKLAKVSCV